MREDGFGHSSGGNIPLSPMRESGFAFSSESITPDWAVRLMSDIGNVLKMLAENQHAIKTLCEHQMLLQKKK